MLLAAFVLLLVAVAWTRGQTSSWDLRNYHLYGAWAWLNDRLERDVAPAQLQSYLNPLLYVPIYGAAQVMSARALTLLLALLQALNVVPLFLLARRLLPERLQRGSPWLAATLAIVGASGATQVGELGATQGDNLLTLPLLGGLALLLGSASTARHVAGAFLIGAAAGLKLTYAPWMAGAVLAAPMLAPPGRRMALSIRVGLAAAAAFVLCAGPWMLEIWLRFGNPIYPMFGAAFPGPLQPPFDTRDGRFLPHGVLDWLLYPLRWLLHPRRVSELWFRDLRVELWFVAMLLPWWRSAIGANDERSRGATFLIAVASFAYLAWLALFGVYRYLAPLEMLAPLLLMLLTALAFPRLDGVRAARWIAPILIVAVLTTRAPDWGHVPFGARLAGSDAPRLAAGTTVVLIGNEPLAFVVPQLGAEADYLRVSGNFVGGSLQPYGLDAEIAARLDRTAGPVLALIRTPPSDALRVDLARFGLDFDGAPCRRINAQLIAPGELPPRLCPLARVRPAREALDAAIEDWSARAPRS